MNYGEFGGKYVPQELKKRLNELEVAFENAIKDENFQKEYFENF